VCSASSIWCWLSSGLPGMFCTMFSLDVLFFACHRLESTTLQPSKVDGLVDVVRGLHVESSLCYSICQFFEPVLNRTSSFVTRYRYVTCKIFCRHRWRKTFNFCAIFVVIFHASLACIQTDSTVALYNHIFVSILITDDVHIDRMRWNTEAALSILQLTSASASPSHARILPR